jgi:hypothetical protein
MGLIREAPFGNAVNVTQVRGQCPGGGKIVLATTISIVPAREYKYYG